jgi:hypothetical protein
MAVPDIPKPIPQEAFEQAGIVVDADGIQRAKDPQKFVTGIKGDGTTIRLNTADFGGTDLAKDALRKKFGVTTENILKKTITAGQLVTSGRK